MKTTKWVTSLTAMKRVISLGMMLALVLLASAPAAVTLPDGSHYAGAQSQHCGNKTGWYYPVRGTRTGNVDSIDDQKLDLPARCMSPVTGGFPPRWGVERTGYCTDGVSCDADTCCCRRC